MTKDIVFPSRSERTFGWCYALFCALCLPWVLNFIVSAVGLTVSGAIINFTYFAVNFLVVAIGFRRFLARTGKDILDRVLWVLLMAVAGFLVYLGLTQLMDRLIIRIRPDFYNVNNQGIASLAGSNYILTLICTVFLVPLTEECLYRGAVFGGLFKKNPVAAYAVSTVVFALVHIDSLFGVVDWPLLALNFLQYLPAGLCLAGTYQLSGSIIAPILIHMAVNAIGIFALR
jgi:membrane protease YdiL (CAAX protease family)